MKKTTLTLLCAAALSGCTTLNLEKIRPQNTVYPEEPAPEAPLVLAIPGLRVPGLRITQVEHYGRLAELLAAEGIPCRILAYDTPEDPVSNIPDVFPNRLYSRLLQP